VGTRARDCRTAPQCQSALLHFDFNTKIITSYQIALRIGFSVGRNLFLLSSADLNLAECQYASQTANEVLLRLTDPVQYLCNAWQIKAVCLVAYFSHNWWHGLAAMHLVESAKLLSAAPC